MKHIEWDKAWRVEYAEDFHAYLRRQEQRLLPYCHQSPQLMYRKALVDCIDQICNSLKFCTRVKHLAVYYLDVFMDNHDIRIQHLQLVAVGCIIVAVKVDEKDSLIPTTSVFSYLLHNKYQLKEFIEMEVSIMQFLKWELLIPTAAIFVEYYLLHSVGISDRQGKTQLQCLEQARLCLLKYINYFLELSIQECAFRDFLPSIVAASCVAMGRLCLHILPTWPLHLKDRTRYSTEDIGPCLAKMITLVHGERPFEFSCLTEVGIDAKDDEKFENLKHDDESDEEQIETYENDEIASSSDEDTIVSLNTHKFEHVSVC